MRSYRYDAASVRGDLRRAALGLILTLGPMFLLGDNSVALAVLTLLSLLFLVFGLRTVLRGMALVHATEQGLSLDPLGGRESRLPGLAPKSVSWREIRKVGLRFYSLKRDRSEGWMELSVGDGKKRLRLDSTLDGFKEIAERAAQAARANGVGVSDNTQANFAALGIRLPAQGQGDAP